MARQFSMIKLCLFLLITRITETFKHNKLVNYCSWNATEYFLLHDTNTCDENPAWYLAHMNNWKLPQEQILAMHFPIDKEKKNFIRQVPNAIFSVVYPTPLKMNPKLAAVDEDVLMELLNLDPDVVKHSDRFLKLVNGDLLFPGVLPLAHRYGGHQFGYWSGQLGDGRAVMLGEYVNHRGQRWELQLKGSGLTPYSRRGDGNAVIRSSVREFLCSEAMHALGIATSRAASLVVSDDPVTRDQFYNGNIKLERAAIVLRLARSWFRIGSLEILTENKEIDLLRSIVDFIIQNYFTDINSTDTDRVLAFYQEVIRETAALIAQWQSIGFTHGVCNTDNFSILSITIDYGPFGFMESYDPNFVPNTSDDEGRYSYANQPEVGRFNLNKLRIALLPLLNINQQKQASVILQGYADAYKSKFMEIFLRKLGFDKKNGYTEDDEQFIAILLKIMEDTEADFTMTFRELSEVTFDDLEDMIKADKSFKEYWTLPVLANHEWFEKWFKVYKQTLHEEGISDTQRRCVMLRTNPRYILRNWIAQVAIEKTEKNDFEEVNRVLKILKRPFTYNKVAEDRGFAGRPPKWSNRLRVSCSS